MLKHTQKLLSLPTVAPRTALVAGAAVGVECSRKRAVEAIRRKAERNKLTCVVMHHKCHDTVQLVHCLLGNCGKVRVYGHAD